MNSREFRPSLPPSRGDESASNQTIRFTILALPSLPQGAGARPSFHYVAARSR